MSRHDYYSDSSRYGQTPSPQPSGSHYAPYGQPAPPYESQDYLAAHDRPSYNASPAPPPKNSPFDTVFDDNVYPAQTPSSSQQQLSQQDTGYHGLARTSLEDMAYNHPADDIPLQPQNRSGAPKDLPGMQDHVYDDAQPQRRRNKRGKVRFGELGMVGANNKKRIPYVVYFFTLVQAIVFIVEIVKNGKLFFLLLSRQPGQPLHEV